MRRRMILGSEMIAEDSWTAARKLRYWHTRARNMLRHPSAYMAALVRAVARTDETELAHLLGTSTEKVRGHYSDLFRNVMFLDPLSGSVQRVSTSDDLRPGLMAKREAVVCYATIRYLRPKVVIETGVASGLSTAYLLQAIADNEAGHLWSIDLPNVDSVSGRPSKYIPDQAMPGWLVPEGLKKNWTLVLGDARVQLPAVLAQTGTVDVFVHDSLHTYEHMSWEYNQVWERMPVGGVLLSHDVHINSAFADFCRERGRPAGRFRNLGVVRK